MVTQPTHGAAVDTVEKWLTQSLSFRPTSFAREIPSMSFSSGANSFSNSACSGFLHIAAINSSSRRSLNSCSTKRACAPAPRQYDMSGQSIKRRYAPGL